MSGKAIANTFKSVMKPKKKPDELWIGKDDRLCNRLQKTSSQTATLKNDALKMRINLFWKRGL